MQSERPNNNCQSPAPIVDVPNGDMQVDLKAHSEHKRLVGFELCRSQAMSEQAQQHGHDMRARAGEYSQHDCFVSS